MASILDPPHPQWRIPFSLIIDGEEREGYLHPIDNLIPSITYKAVIDEQQISIIHLATSGWWAEMNEYRVFKDDLVAYIVAWWGDVELKAQVYPENPYSRKPGNMR